MNFQRLPVVTLVLAAVLLVVQAQLWVGASGKPYAMALQLQVDRQHSANEQARLVNAQLEAEVRDLREGLEMVEERARSELGMVKPNEILVQVSSAPR
jgi:cell division protein FtsB